jgi:hypothetical protein
LRTLLLIWLQRTKRRRSDQGFDAFGQVTALAVLLRSVLKAPRYGALGARSVRGKEVPSEPVACYEHLLQLGTQTSRPAVRTDWYGSAMFSLRATAHTLQQLDSIPASDETQ